MTHSTYTPFSKVASILAAVSLSMTFVSGTATADTTTHIVKVHCPSQSINKAIETSPDKGRVIVVIEGTCHENVTIHRGDVTLRGNDPGSSKIIGVAEADRYDESPVTVEAPGRIEIENITLAGGTSSGIAVVASRVELRNCILENNGLNGAALIGGGLLRIDNCTARNNVKAGVYAQGGGIAEITNSTIDSNGTNGVVVGRGSRALIGKNLMNEPGATTIRGNAEVAVLASDNGSVDLANSTVESAGRTAVSALRSSSVLMENSLVTATGDSSCAVFIGDGSALSLNEGNTLISGAATFSCAALSVQRNSTARVSGSGNTIENTGPGSALEVGSVSSLRIDPSVPATVTIVRGNVQAYNLSTADLRRVVVNGNIWARSPTSNVRLLGSSNGAVTVNGDVFPSNDSAADISNNGSVFINGNIDCTNGQNVRADFHYFGSSGHYVNCSF